MGGIQCRTDELFCQSACHRLYCSEKDLRRHAGRRSVCLARGSGERGLKTGTGTSQKGSQSPSFIALPKKTGFERVTPVGCPPQKRARVIGASTGRWKAGETGGRTRDTDTGSRLSHFIGEVNRPEKPFFG